MMGRSRSRGRRFPWPCIVLALGLLLGPALAGVRDGAPTGPVLPGLLQEAAALERQPAAWRDVQDRLAAAFAADEEMVRRRQGMAGLPPRLDLTPLTLPLSVLGRGAVEAQDYRHWIGFLNAIVASDDLRRIPLLIELQARTEAAPSGQPGGARQPDRRDWMSESGWAWMLRQAATPDWAEEQIPALIAAGGGRLRQPDLGFQLLDRFAAELRPETRQRGYDAVRAVWPDGLTTSTVSQAEGAWKLLMRLDPRRAGDELALSLSRRETDLLHVLSLLQDHAVPSETLAAALIRTEQNSRGRQWWSLAEPDFQVALLRADPRNRLPAALRYAEAAIRREPRECCGTFAFKAAVEIVRRGLETDASQVVPRFAHLLGRRYVPDAVGLALLDALAARRDRSLARHVRAWLAATFYTDRRVALLERARGWNDEGRRVAEAAAAG